MLDGGKEYIEEARELEANGTELYVTSHYTPEENGRVEGMTRTIESAIRMMFLHSGALANSRSQCFYALCDARNHNAISGLRKT